MRFTDTLRRNPAMAAIALVVGIVFLLSLATFLSVARHATHTVDAIDGGSLTGRVGVTNRDPYTQTQPRDFCMFSALINGYKGEVYIDDIDERGIDGAVYKCSIVLDHDSTRHYYTVTDSGIR